MEDIPQGGAGGVPGHHGDEPREHHHDDQDDRRTPTVKTVRAGTPVAEQEPEGGKSSSDATPGDDRPSPSD
ncbi:hypothetical protein [Kitasatospora sp. DSM 101779]|jgi:hypothetical protein|uniref:hypothetical protein n=1 Tax=Kitasatospora sp. DSM 101779 TaxID=2853165 RepID=UPI0021D88DD3|nr:hypothetical protein [Kitasatospora sp. DSM 101779]MCU7826811.1 hypothetical protein [Kitasatospora sp. DSM 101779]